MTELATLLALGIATLQQPGVARIYVSPDGRDGAVTTLAAAQTKVRELCRDGLTRPVEVILRGGTYNLPEPLKLGPEDSGTADCPVTYRAANGEQVTISGGVPVTGWARRGDLWLAPATGLPPGLRLLRVGDKWAARARHPNADPSDRIKGGWTFADFGGEPWERGAFGTAVSNTHNVGTRLTWRVRMPADGAYAVWLRYGHHMTDYNIEDMAGHSVLSVDDGPQVPLENLPDTGSWGTLQWSSVCSLNLTAGEHVLAWENVKGGGLQLDAFALTDDQAWDPAQAIGPPTWWGAATIAPPADGKHLLIVQCEACETAVGAELSVPDASPPGTTTDMRFREGALPQWAGVTGAEVHIFIAWGWVNAIVPIDRIEYPDRRIVFAGEAAQDVRVGNRFFVENVRAALDAPGEWYQDSAAGEVLYMPDDPAFSGADVTAPILDRLIVLEGDPAAGRFVENVHFRGLRFADTTYNLTTDYYTPQDACVVMSGARDCSVEDCEFPWLGGYAVKLANRSERCTVLRNQAHDMGQGGVILVDGTADEAHHCEVLGNTLERLGLIYKHVAGVYVCHGSDNRIAHNRIVDVPRYAVSVKSQGEEALSQRNVVEYNEMIRTNLETNDTGAFESLGYEHRDSGNIVRYNLILDSVGLMTTAAGEIQSPCFTWGVYLDDYSSGTTVYGNIVARTVVGGVCVHGGQNNIIRNNVFVEGHDHQVRLQPRDEFMKGNEFVNNIVAYSRPESQLVFSWRSAKGLFAEWDRNVYWLKGSDIPSLGAYLTPEGTWEQWLAAGFDAHSALADPLFVDPEHDDYRLQPDSPAFALGFEPIPVDRIGPKGLERQARRA